MKNSKGFTLVEMAVVIIVTGVMTILLSPVFSSMSTAQKNAYQERNRLNNQIIGNALLSYAANSTLLGRLPTPYTGSGWTKTVYNPDDSSTSGTLLTQTLNQTGLSTSEINADGKSALNVRAYQLVQNLYMEVPLYFKSGPVVTLTYDFGAIYLTECPKANSSCNPRPSTGLPGVSSEMTATNYTSWQPADSEKPATFISSLPIQKQMLATTVQRLDKLRDSLLSYLRTQQMTASGGDTTNWYPNQQGLAASGSMAGNDPASNQGCRDGWYNLADNNVGVLPVLGLAKQEFGITAWGGVIQYCRDYDPTGTSPENSPPHYAAIRINKYVSSGLAPDSGLASNNIVLTL